MGPFGGSQILSGSGEAATGSLAKMASDNLWNSLVVGRDVLVCHF